MKRLTTILMLTVLVVGFTSSVHADRQSREEEKARQQRLELQQQQVESILRQETAGQVTDRKAALKEVLASGEAPDEAYWQAGYIRQGDKWVSVADRWLTPEQERELEEYTKARYNYADSDEGQYKLAQWCDEHGFEDQAYAHLKAVLLNNPDHAGLRQLLGYQQIGNRWMNEEEFNVAVREANRLVQELQRWGPRIIEIRDGLHSPDLRQQNGAKTKLKKITEVAAISALELILLFDSDVSAQLCVEQLCQIKHQRSSIALCKAAIFLPESADTAKQAAIAELKARPLDDYVPVLLGKMQTPLNAQLSLLWRGWQGNSHGPFNMPLKYYYSWQRDWAEVTVNTETMNEIRTKTLVWILRDYNFHFGMADNNGLNAYTAAIDQGLFSRSFDLESSNMPHNGGQAAEFRFRNRSGWLLQIQKAIEADNDQIRSLNQDIASLLSRVTGQPDDEFPEYWWSWWNARLEVESGEKAVREVRELDQIEDWVNVRSSCFTAGTPVWTDRGARPIEQLKIGDMALTQDVETGELVYRPIIRTTTREPKPLVTIDLGVEQIVSTGGHPFFVSGEGWVRARELQAGQILHTPTGSIPIVSVTETPDQETYNLVVDGYHTYFVGMSQVLVHDVSITSPTDAIVPGLLNR